MVAAAVYLLTAVFFVARLVWQIWQVLQMVRGGKAEKHKGYSVVCTEKNTSPFSFFGWVILNPQPYSQGQLRHIITHEKNHVRQCHTLDIIFMELFTAVFWFHPAAWGLKRLAKLNLEYIADRESLRTGAEAKEYQYNLLKVCFAHPPAKTVMYFNQSHLKKRIVMMNVKNSTRNLVWKYLLFVPAVALLAAVLQPVRAQNAQRDNMDTYLVIRQDMSESRLADIKKHLAEQGIDISFSNITYDQQHLLTGIKVTVAKDGRQVADVAVLSNGTPIAKPVVFYMLGTRQGKTGLRQGYPSDVSANDTKILINLNGLLTSDNPATKGFELHGSAKIE
jgi:hypothetical protein